MHAEALAAFVPRRVIRRLTPEDAATEALPAAMAGIVTASAGPRGYARSGTSCRAPADSVEAWRRTLGELREAASAA